MTFFVHISFFNCSVIEQRLWIFSSTKHVSTSLWYWRQPLIIHPAFSCLQYYNFLCKKNFAPGEARTPDLRISMSILTYKYDALTDCATGAWRILEHRRKLYTFSFNGVIWIKGGNLHSWLLHAAHCNTKKCNIYITSICFKDVVNNLTLISGKGRAGPLHHRYKHKTLQ